MQSATGEKAPDAFRTIGELSRELGVAQHILRYWETKFPQLKPLKRAGNRRYYRPDDVALARTIKHLLDDRGFTIRGVQKVLRDKASAAEARDEAAPAAPAAPAAGPGPAQSIDIDRIIALRDRLARIAEA